jgi:hypothetical protein
LSQTFLLADKVCEYLFSVTKLQHFSSILCVCLLCLDHSPSWEASSYSASQVMPCLLSNPKVHKSNQVWTPSIVFLYFTNVKGHVLNYKEWR